MNPFDLFRSSYLKMMDDLFKAQEHTPFSSYVAHIQNKRNATHFHARRRNAGR